MSSNQRFRRAAEAVHTLGPRATVEALAEIAVRSDPAMVEAVIERYARLDPGLLAALGADRLPPRPIHAVGSGS